MFQDGRAAARSTRGRNPTPTALPAGPCRWPPYVARCHAQALASHRGPPAVWPVPGAQTVPRAPTRGACRRAIRATATPGADWRPQPRPPPPLRRRCCAVLARGGADGATLLARSPLAAARHPLPTAAGPYCPPGAMSTRYGGWDGHAGPGHPLCQAPCRPSGPPARTQPNPSEAASAAAARLPRRLLGRRPGSPFVPPRQGSRRLAA